MFWRAELLFSMFFFFFKYDFVTYLFHPAAGNAQKMLFGVWCAHGVNMIEPTPTTCNRWLVFLFLSSHVLCRAEPRLVVVLSSALWPLFALRLQHNSIRCRIGMSGSDQHTLVHAHTYTRSFGYCTGATGTGTRSTHTHMHSAQQWSVVAQSECRMRVGRRLLATASTGLSIALGQSQCTIDDRRRNRPVFFSSSISPSEVWLCEWKMLYVWCIVREWVVSARVCVPFPVCVCACVCGCVNGVFNARNVCCCCRARDYWSFTYFYSYWLLPLPTHLSMPSTFILSFRLRGVCSPHVLGASSYSSSTFFFTVPTNHHHHHHRHRHHRVRGSSLVVFVPHIHLSAVCLAVVQHCRTVGVSFVERDDVFVCCSSLVCRCISIWFVQIDDDDTVAVDTTEIMISNERIKKHTHNEENAMASDANRIGNATDATEMP